MATELEISVRIRATVTISADDFKRSVVESQRKLAPYDMEQQKAPKWNEPGYWKYWYWNRGGRDKVQATRKVAEYKRYLREKGE